MSGLRTPLLQTDAEDLGHDPEVRFAADTEELRRDEREQRLSGTGYVRLSAKGFGSNRSVVSSTMAPSVVFSDFDDVEAGFGKYAYPDDASTTASQCSDSNVGVDVQHAAKGNDELVTPFGEPQSEMNTAEATFVLVNFLFNFGMFSIPFAFSTTGFSAILLVVVTAGLAMFQGRLIGSVLESLQANGCARPTFGDAARTVLGPAFATGVSVFSFLECLVYLWGNAVVLVHTVVDLVPALQEMDVVVMSCIVGSVFSIVPDKIYSYVSLMGALSIATVCIVVLMSGWEMPEWAHGDRLIGPVMQLPTSFCMIIFCAGTHPLLPSVYNGTKPAVYERAVKYAWSIWALFAIVLGSLAYYMFGNAIQVVVTRNIARDTEMIPMPGAQQLAVFASVWVVFRTITGLVPITRPLTEGLARLLRVELPRGNGGWRCCLLSIPVFIIVGTGAHVFLHRIALLESLAGGILVSFNEFIIPSVLFLRLCASTPMRRMSASITGLFGVVLAVGLVVSKCF